MAHGSRLTANLTLNTLTRHKLITTFILAFVFSLSVMRGMSFAASWYVVKNGDGVDHNIKYYKDESGGYNQSNWSNAENSSSTSMLPIMTNNMGGTSLQLSGGDNVYVHSGTYYFSSFRISPTVTINIYGGFSGSESSLSDRNFSANPTILNGQQQTWLFNLQNDSVIDGFTITNGSRSGAGGGIYLGGSGSPKITNCTIKGNSAAKGGGIYLEAGSAEITGCEISGNTATSEYGGGIYVYNGTPTITGCTVSGNKATSGGGIYIYDDTPTITGCTVSGNTATEDGGGIYVELGAVSATSDPCAPQITNCTITANKADSYGGGAYWQGEGSLVNCALRGNEANMGGGMYVNYKPSVSGCTFAGNKVASGGGGIYINNTATFTNCTIAGNTTGGSSGGGIYVQGGASSFTFCTVAGNMSSGLGREIYSIMEITMSDSLIWSSGAGLALDSLSTETVLTFTNCALAGPASLNKGTITSSVCFMSVRAGLLCHLMLKWTG